MICLQLNATCNPCPGLCRTTAGSRTMTEEHNVLHTSMVELLYPLQRSMTTGNFMKLALTCHTLYVAILGWLRSCVRECIKQPFSGQTIIMMDCAHKCSKQKTAFVHKPTSTGRLNCCKICCTHCLYCYRINSTQLPASTWWITPQHAVIVQKIMNEIGFRHSLLIKIYL